MSVGEYDSTLGRAKHRFEGWSINESKSEKQTKDFINDRCDILFDKIFTKLGIDSLQWLSIFPLVPIIRSCFNKIMQRIAKNEFKHDLAVERLDEIKRLKSSASDKDTKEFDANLQKFCNKFIKQTKMQNFDLAKMKDAIRDGGPLSGTPLEKWGHFKNACTRSTASK